MLSEVGSLLLGSRAAAGVETKGNMFISLDDVEGRSKRGDETVHPINDKIKKSLEERGNSACFSHFSMVHHHARSQSAFEVRLVFFFFFFFLFIHYPRVRPI